MSIVFPWYSVLSRNTIEGVTTSHHVANRVIPVEDESVHEVDEYSKYLASLSASPSSRLELRAIDRNLV